MHRQRVFITVRSASAGFNLINMSMKYFTVDSTEFICPSIFFLTVDNAVMSHHWSAACSSWVGFNVTPNTLQVISGTATACNNNNIRQSQPVPLTNDTCANRYTFTQQACVCNQLATHCPHSFTIKLYLVLSLYKKQQPQFSITVRSVICGINVKTVIGNVVTHLKQQKFNISLDL